MSRNKQGDLAWMNIDGEAEPDKGLTEDSLESDRGLDMTSEEPRISQTKGHLESKLQKRVQSIDEKEVQSVSHDKPAKRPRPADLSSPAKKAWPGKEVVIYQSPKSTLSNKSRPVESSSPAKRGRPRREVVNNQAAKSSVSNKNCAIDDDTIQELTPEDIAKFKAGLGVPKKTSGIPTGTKMAKKQELMAHSKKKRSSLPKAVKRKVLKL
jgi:hypothetical protein